jgi:HlyD family secretion protein
MKKLLTTLIILALGGGGAYYYFVYGKAPEKPQMMQATITRGDITDSVSATGTLEALRTVSVGSQVSGVVQDLFVDFNSIVHSGEVIAQIDPTLLQQQVDIQQANIDRQEGDIANTEVQLESDQKNLDRTQEQFDKGLVSPQQLEAAQLQVKVRQASIDSAKKQLVQTRANLKQAQLNVEYCTIKSPIDGVIVSRAVDKGQTVQASMNTPQFFTIATDLRDLKLTAGVDEADVGKMQVGQDVTFTVDAYPDTFRGKVNSVRLNAQTQNNVVTYPVWIDAPNPELKLRPSMTAQAKIIISTVKNALRVPNQATRFRPNADIYLALGLTPPQAGQGRAGRGGGRGGGQNAQNGQGGQGGQRGNRTPGQAGQGFGGQGANLTPEQRAQMAQRFGGRGGRRGQDTTPAEPVAPKALNATKIDALFEPVKAIISPATVWTWDETKKELKAINIRTGVSDGQFSEIVSGDLQVGQQVLTGVILPTAGASNPSRPNNQNPLMGPQRGGFGGGGRRGGGD